MTISSNLKRPTKLVTVVDQQTNENYIQLNQYRLMEEIGQVILIKFYKICFRDHMVL